MTDYITGILTEAGTDPTTGICRAHVRCLETELREVRTLPMYQEVAIVPVSTLQQWKNEEAELRRTGEYLHESRQHMISRLNTAEAEVERLRKVEEQFKRSDKWDTALIAENRNAWEERAKTAEAAIEAAKNVYMSEPDCHADHTKIAHEMYATLERAALAAVKGEQ